jgi:hypothetical protein
MHWDVIQREATQEQSKSGRPMFGDSFPLYRCAGTPSRGFLTGAPWEGHRGAGKDMGTRVDNNCSRPCFLPKTKYSHPSIASL